MTDWQCLAASAVGRRHQEKGVPNQDALSVVAGSDWRLFVVADGAGSAIHGGEGASSLVDACAAQAHLLYADGLPSGSKGLRTSLYRLLARVRKGLEQEASDRGCALSDLASTVALVVVDEHRLGAAQIGDGAVVVQRRGDSPVQIVQTLQPEFVNQTSFLTSVPWRESASVEVVELSDIVGLVLITDGLVPLATSRPGGEPHAPFFEPLFDFAGSPGASNDELGQLLASDRVQERTGDDVTLLIATRAIG